MSSLEPPGTYRRVYAPAGGAGTCLVQEVQTLVRYLRGDVALAEHTSRYGEYFQIGARALGADLWDVHDFVLSRDGWTPGRLWKLLRSTGLVTARMPPGGGEEPRLEVRKTFLLAPGHVEDVVPCVSSDDGGAFGYLADGPQGPPQAELQLSWSRERRVVVPPRAHPFGRTAHGSGRFSGAPGWRAEELFRYRFATRSGHLDDGGGYQPWAPELGADAASS